MNRVYIAAGSNKGDKNSNVIRALQYIGRHVFIKKISAFMKNAPAEGASGGFFINGAIEGKTGLTPVQLFEFLQEVEKAIGRKHPHKKGDAREIDLDIIFYGSIVIKTGSLVIPHPGYRKRIFVMEPLFGIAPDLVDPETKKTVASTYMELKK